jgi:hypothetical protein
VIIHAHGFPGNARARVRIEVQRGIVAGGDSPNCPSARVSIRLRSTEIDVRFRGATTAIALTRMSSGTPLRLSFFWTWIHLPQRLNVARYIRGGWRREGAELEEARADPMGHSTDLAVSVLNRAQQLVDSLIDEAVQSGS